MLLAQRLPIAHIPEQHRVALVRFDVVNNGSSADPT
jgi:hypothetical protein